MQAVQKLIYLYCVTKTKPDFNNFKNIEAEIYPIYSQGIYAVVSEVSLDEFKDDNLKKNLESMEWVEKMARRHEMVIEEIMKESTALPFKFAAVFQKEESIKKLLRERNADFKRMIAGLNGKEERGLKIYCNMEKFKDAIQKEDERINNIENEMITAAKGKAFFLKKKKDGILKDIINEKISECVQDCFDRIKRVCLEIKINKILSKEVTEKTDEMVLNIAFLISMKRLKEFNNIFEYLKVKYPDKGLSFDCTGPWPPYNFCNL